MSFTPCSNGSLSIIGKNDGSVAGIRYFQCAPHKGIFARPTRLSRSPVDFQHLHDTSYAPSVSPDARSISSFSYTSSAGGPVDRRHSNFFHFFLHFFLFGHSSVVNLFPRLTNFVPFFFCFFFFVWLNPTKARYFTHAFEGRTALIRSVALS